MTVLSIFIACRMGDNDNSALGECLNSLCNNANDTMNFEVLIKFDEDDLSLPRLLEIAEKYKKRVVIKTIVTSRANGYKDLHKAYNDLLLIANENSVLYWVLSDDVVINTKGWDKILQSSIPDYSDNLFVLCNKIFDHDYMTPREVVEQVECYPLWSATWINIQGGFGNFFSTDGWTALLCHKLRTKYGIDRRIPMDVKIERALCDKDKSGSDRWVTIREQTILLMLSPQSEKLLDGTARAFVSYIKTNGVLPLEVPKPHPRIIQTIPFSVLAKEMITRIVRKIA